LKKSSSKQSPTEPDPAASADCQRTSDRTTRGVFLHILAGGELCDRCFGNSHPAPVEGALQLALIGFGDRRRE
jgi:hypothetical protein